MSLIWLLAKKVHDEYAEDDKKSHPISELWNELDL